MSGDQDGQLRQVVLRPDELHLVEAILDEIEIGACVLVGHEELLGLVGDDLRDLVDVLAEAVRALLLSLADSLLAEADALRLVINHILFDLASLCDWPSDLGWHRNLLPEFAVVGVEVLASDLLDDTVLCASFQLFHPVAIGVGHRLRRVGPRRVLERREATALLLLRLVLMEELVASVERQGAYFRQFHHGLLVRCDHLLGLVVPQALDALDVVADRVEGLVSGASHGRQEAPHRLLLLGRDDHLVA